MHVFALVSDAYGGNGGISLYNRDFFQALAKESETKVFAQGRWQSGPEQSQPANVNFKVSGSWFRYIFDCWLFANQQPIDLVFCGHLNLLPLSFALAKRHRVPLILQIHGIEAWQPTPRRLTNWLTRYVDGVLSVSRHTLERYLSWSKTNRERCQVLHNAVHIDWFDPGIDTTCIKRKLNIENRIVLLTFGRLVSQQRAKGFDEVLELLPMVAESVPNVVYVIAGDGPDAPRLRDKVQLLGLQEKVVFTGYVEENEKNELFAAADLFVMPSRGEGFGYVFLEALACGVPVVGSTTDGSFEALLEGQLGRVVDPSDRSALLQAILNGLKEPRGVPPLLNHFTFGRFADEVRKSVRGVYERGTVR